MASPRVMLNYLHACLNVTTAKKIPLPEYDINGGEEWCFSITLHYSNFEISYYYQKILKLFPNAKIYNPKELNSEFDVKQENLTITIATSLLREKLTHDLTKAAAYIFNSFPPATMQCKFISENLLALGLVEAQNIHGLLDKFNSIGLFNLENLTPQFASHKYSPFARTLIMDPSTPVPSIKLSTRRLSIDGRKIMSTPISSHPTLASVEPHIFDFSIPPPLNSHGDILAHSSTVSESSHTTGSSHPSLSSHASLPATPTLNAAFEPPFIQVPDDEFTIQITPYTGTPSTIIPPKIFLPPESRKIEGYSMARIKLDHPQTDFSEMLRYINRPSLELMSNYVEALLSKDQNISFPLPKATFTDANENSATLTFNFVNIGTALPTITGLMSIFRGVSNSELAQSEDYLTIKISIDLLLNSLKDDFNRAIYIILQKFPDEKMQWTYMQDFLYLDNISYANHERLMQEFSAWGLSNQRERPQESNPRWMNSADVENETTIITPYDIPGFRSEIIYLNSSKTDLKLMLAEMKYYFECKYYDALKLARINTEEVKKAEVINDFETDFPDFVPPAPPLILR